MGVVESTEVQKLGGLLNPCSIPEEKRVRVDNYCRNIVIADDTLQLQELLQGPAVSPTKGIHKSCSCFGRNPVVLVEKTQGVLDT